MSQTLNFDLVRGIYWADFIESLREPLKKKGLLLRSRAVERDYFFHDLAVGQSGSDSTMTIFIPNWKVVETLSPIIREFFLSRTDALRLSVTQFQESNWFYTLRQGKEILDEFCVLPDAYEESPELWGRFRGNLALLAEAWKVDPKKIQDYLRWWHQPRVLPEDVSEEEEDEYWDELDYSGKAYPEDKHEYGDAWQMLDFAQAMGCLWPITARPEWLHFELVPAGKV